MLLRFLQTLTYCDNLLSSSIYWVVVLGTGQMKELLNKNSTLGKSAMDILWAFQYEVSCVCLFFLKRAFFSNCNPCVKYYGLAFDYHEWIHPALGGPVAAHIARV